MIKVPLLPKTTRENHFLLKRIMYVWNVPRGAEIYFQTNFIDSWIGSRPFLLLQTGQFAFHSLVTL